MRLADFRVLSFDCYGTLIDWESGIAAALAPLLARAGVGREAALAAFARHEPAVEAEAPGLRYPAVLARTHQRLSREFGCPTTEAEDAAFGASVPDWPAFPDSAAALAKLKRHYKLMILSNVDRASFAASNARLGVAFDAVVTAEDVGSYKPDPANFRALLVAVARLGHEPRELLHTAQSLFHDHVPARALGLATSWIDRRDARAGGATPAAEAGYDFRFPSLAAMAEAREAER